MTAASLFRTHETSDSIRVLPESRIASTRTVVESAGRKRAKRIVSLADAVKQGRVGTVDITDMSDSELFERYARFITK